MSLVRCFAVVLIVGASLAWAQSPDAARKEIEASYAKVLDALKHAKSMDDLDEINRSFDTMDWRSITPDNPRLARSAEVWFRKRVGSVPIRGNDHRYVSTVGRHRGVHGQAAQCEHEGRVAYIPLKETWKRTVIGWKRQMHQKFRAGETPK
jgi:hypothetical protein